MRIHPLSDSSGYYVTGADSSNKANICKYLFSSPTSSQCQKLSSFEYYSYGSFQLSDSTFFLISNDPATYALHFYMHSFSSVSPIWSDTMACPTSPCGAFFTAFALLNSKIYTFFNYGNPKYLYFAIFSMDGTVQTERYKSSTSCTNGAYFSIIKGDYIIVSLLCAGANLLVMNTITKEISIKTFSGTYLFMIALESTGR